MALPTFSSQSDDFNTAIGLTNPNMSTLGGIVNTIMTYLIPIGGLVLLVMIISGGITMMTAISDPKAAEAGKQRVTSALIGFIILFAAYWIVQLLEIVLGVNILQG
ncbi:hypothetical protein A3B57_02500 [Microgenomates group bacterium RIFCSPLOWO2_01_FULL_47_10]|nr:MAG: hypothetical protein A3B57_02500 [Microgenomates group bacterium RIFCSPLOWO2_01_FULL_47_10]